VVHIAATAVIVWLLSITLVLASVLYGVSLYLRRRASCVNNLGGTP
jgi:hypothetical protein